MHFRRYGRALIDLACGNVIRSSAESGQTTRRFAVKRRFSASKIGGLLIAHQQIAAGSLYRPTCDTIAMRHGDEFHDGEEVFGLSAAGAAPGVRRAVPGQSSCAFWRDAKTAPVWRTPPPTDSRSLPNRSRLGAQLWAPFAGRISRMVNLKLIYPPIDGIFFCSSGGVHSVVGCSVVRRRELFNLLLQGRVDVSSGA